MSSDWVTIHGRHIHLDDGETIAQAVEDLHQSKPTAPAPDKKKAIATPEGQEKAPNSVKSERAKASASRVDKVIQRYSEERNEPVLARTLSGDLLPKRLNDNEPVDVQLNDEHGNVQHGIELKTMVDNKASKITMSKSAVQKKMEWERSTGRAIHTVVFDDQGIYNAGGEGVHGDESGRTTYYKRGYGSFRTGTMERVRDAAHLQQLIHMPDADLPKNARGPKRDTAQAVSA